ncbi:MAG: hypothetical protein U1B30_15820 [Pseudomonadota bacterium]|nr:hypothetical protein [Pseudomonadota bacterium]
MREIRLALVPGKRYRVTFEDCCVNGEFTGVFLRWEEDGEAHQPADEGDVYGHRAIFDTGSVERNRWEAEEV